MRLDARYEIYRDDRNEIYEWINISVDRDLLTLAKLYWGSNDKWGLTALVKALKEIL